MSLALVLAASLVMAAPPAEGGGAHGEPLPASAPTDSYELAAWCYGALDEYLQIYQKIIPDLKDIDRMFGTQVKETQPYHSDMAAARVELKMLGGAVTDAEKASPTPISERGVDAMSGGRQIWSIAETKPHRELARAWMMWGLPDRCDANARELAKRSLLLGKALSFNQGGDKAADGAAPAPDQPPPAADHPPPPPGENIDTVLSKPPSGDAPAADAPAGGGDAPPKSN
jgi:hypothetical protein